MIKNKYIKYIYLYTVDIHALHIDLHLPFNIPTELTWRILATSYLDINSVPKKYFWIVLHNLMKLDDGDYHYLYKIINSLTIISIVHSFLLLYV